MAKKNTETKPVELKITPKEKEKLSKEQRAFNRNTVRIEKLRVELEETIVLHEHALEKYTQTLKPLREEDNNLYIETSHKLSEKTKEYKFTKKQKEAIGQIIIYFLNIAFSEVEPDEATKELYDSWSPTSYDEELEEEKDIEREMMEDFLKTSMGVDVDLSDFEGSPEDINKLFEKLHGEAEKQEQEQEKNEKKQNRRKTKRQLLAEKKKAEEEALKLKSVRSIYISLVKALHPDLAQNEEQRLKNEELMKKVTTAYSNKDLSTLLKLEIEWVSSIKEVNADNLSEKKLKLYNSVLLEQIKELQFEAEKVMHNPRYKAVWEFVGRSKGGTTRKINTHEKELNSIIASKKYDLERLDKSKREILNFVSDISSIFSVQNEEEEFKRMILSMMEA